MRNFKIMKNKFLVISFLLIVFSFAFTNSIFAEKINENSGKVQGVFDNKEAEGTYKLSNEIENIYLPFVRFASERILIDKNVSNMGVLFSGKTIEVENSTKGIQALFSSDSARINANMEYAVIFSGTDVVIDSNIDRSIIIFAGGKVTFTEKSNVAEDVIIYASSVEINGNIKGSVIGSTENLNINGIIEKDLRVDATNVETLSNNNILGQIFVRTSNENLNIQEKYLNATVNFIQKKEVSDFDSKIIIKGITVSLIFTLLYIFVQKITNKKLYTYMINKSKNNIVFLILSSIILLITMPIITIILLLISITGFSIITLPLLLVYITSLIVIISLSTFIVGSVSFEYVKNKYMKDVNVWTELVGVFCTFAMLYILSNIPYLSGYVKISLIVIALGLVITTIFKREKKID